MDRRPLLGSHNQGLLEEGSASFTSTPPLWGPLTGPDTDDTGRVGGMSVSLGNNYGAIQEPEFDDPLPPERPIRPASSLDRISEPRAPFEYRASRHAPAQSAEEKLAANTYQRYRYYSKLAPANKTNHLVPPKSVLPTNLFILALPGEKAEGTQSSLITILSLWNTMMGSSILTMPWAIQQAGFSLGIGTLIFMAGVTYYTCWIVLKSGEGGRMGGVDVEFPDVCRHYLGQRAYVVAMMFSVLTLLGASMVYWVLMSTFLYSIVDYAHDPHRSADIHDDEGTWGKAWNTKLTSVYLFAILFPLINFKSLKLFTKFNALGICSILYILVFVFGTAARGDDDKTGPVGGLHFDHVEEARPGFVILAGVLSLSFFIHNGCLSIMRNQRNPKNNSRDLGIAYVLVCLTYLAVGVCFFLSFRGDKSKINSNFLLNFNKDDAMFKWALIAQIFLLFQMITVYPLLQFIIRFQVMNTLFNTPWPGLLSVMILNVCVSGVCMAMGSLYPRIGNIIRFTGSTCGLVYIFLLPCAVRMIMLLRERKATPVQWLLHLTLVLLGIGNVMGQFLVHPN